jgi:predicted MFS family arabinose efflux permease
MLARLLWLSVGTFVIGAESFILIGILPGIADDLDVSIAACGQLVSAYALAYAIGSPILATLLAGAPRKPMLIGAIVVFAIGNALAGLADSLVLLFLVRILLGLAAGVFTPTANAVAVALVPPAMRGRAIATVIGGMTVAVAFGAPIGTFLAAQGSWRTPFFIVAGVSALAAIGLIAGLPRDLPRSAATLRERIALAAEGPVLRALLVTFFWSMSAFVVFTFVAPILLSVGIEGSLLSLAFLAFGIASALGNALGGVVVDRIGAVRTQAIGLALLVLSLAAIPVLATALPASVAGFGVVAALAVWGLAGWSFYPAQSARLVGIAPAAPVVALSLNSSMLFFGQAAGAGLASLAATAVAPAELGFIGAACAIAALGVLRWSAGGAMRRVAAPAE